MRSDLVIRSPRDARRLLRLAPFMAPALLLASRAHAQAVTGSIDPATGLANLAPYVLGLATASIVLITMWKGGHAVAEGRSFGPALVGLIGGLALAVGGYYVLNHYGVTATTGV